MNNEILEHKRTPEELGLQAEVVLEMSQTGTGQELLEKAKNVQKRFEYLEEEGAENSERIEEAKNDMQSFEALEKEFNELIATLKEGFDALKNKPKKPIGNVQETIDEQLVSHIYMYLLYLFEVEHAYNVSLWCTTTHSHPIYQTRISTSI